ncbi:MAG: hypothetical protein ACE5FU_07100, partial [Nitrospinota bacterium]
MISKLFPVLFLLLFLSGCQYSAWKKVQEQNTVFSYENFLKKYPTGTYSDEARDAIEFLDWEDAGKQKSAAAFQKFIEKYPRSKFVGVATRLKEEADLRAAEKENTLGAYQEFIRKYPKSKLKKRAQKKMGELSWEAARKKNSVTGYREFLDTGKESMFKAEAEKRLEQLQLEKYEIASFKEAEQENTLDSYRLFLEIYPRGVYAKKAISLLIPLLPESMKERVEDLLSLNPLSRARGVLTLAKFDPDRLLLITPLLMNSLADTTPIHPKGRVWEKSTTIGGEIQKIFYSLGKRAVPSLNFALLL